jgi:hypothetical protein
MEHTPCPWLSKFKRLLHTIRNGLIRHFQDIFAPSFAVPDYARISCAARSLKALKKLVVKFPAFSYLLPQPHLSGAGANWICPKMHVQKPYNREQLTSEEPDEV